METLQPEERRGPGSLRVAGFVVTALGGLLLGVGSILTWGTVTLGQGGQGFGALETKGIDLAEGKVALAAALIVLIGIPAMRSMLSRMGRRVWAGITIVMSAISGALIVWVLLNPDERVGYGAASEQARRIAEASGLSADEILNQIQALTTTQLKPGIYVALAGAVLALVGGFLSLMWANSAPLLSATDVAEERAALEQAALETDRPDDVPPSPIV